MTSQITGASARNSSNKGVVVAGRSVEASLKLRWLYLLPAVFVTYSLAYLDRANYGFGAAAGLAATLHITEQDTAILGGLFFLGYFAFQIPGAAVARKYSVRRVVFATLVAWGVLAAVMGVIRQFWLLALDRFLLGVAESLIFPVMLHLLTRWFTRAERSRANAILLLGNPVTVLWMSAITGYLIQRYGWQMTFIIEGLPSVPWAVVWILFVRDRPCEARWITRDAAKLLEVRLTQEQAGIAPVGAVRNALLRGDVLLLSVQYFCWSLGVYGFVLWLPTIVHRGATMSMAQTALSRCHSVDAVCVAHLRQNAEAPVFGMAVLAHIRNRVSGLFLFFSKKLYAYLSRLGNRRRLHVRAVRPIFRNHPGTRSPKCDGRSFRAHQQLRSARRLFRQLPGWIAAGDYGKRTRWLFAHVGLAHKLRDPSDVPAGFSGRNNAGCR
jgi:MFS family permease